MPLSFPALGDLRTQFRNFFAARLPGISALVRRNNVMVAADAMAAACNAENIYIAGLPDAVLMPDTAIQPYLDRWASWYGLTRIPAAAAAGSVQFSGTNSYTIPAGTLIATSDGSVEYATQAAVTISGGAATAAVIATAGGSAGNAAAGTPLGLVVAIAGVQATAVVLSAGLTGGIDEETDAAFQARLALRVQRPPQGGAPWDYVAWAKGSGITNPYPGVTRAWSFPQNRGLGTCDVTFVMDGRAPGSIIPLAGDIAAVQAQINYVKAAGSVIVFALTADPTAITVANLAPNNATVQAAVQAGLTALFATTTPGNAQFGDGVSTLVPGGHLNLDDIYQAIKNSAGVQEFDLTAPAADVVSAQGHIAQLGSVTIT